MLSDFCEKIMLRCSFPAIWATIAGMDILLNGQPATIDDACTIERLLEEQQLSQQRVAVEVNAQIVPRGQHANYCLQAGDRVEVVRALGGG